MPEKIFYYKYSVNGKAKSWRDWLGNCLRSIASRIDHRESLGVRIESVPELPIKTKRECITFGFQQMKFALHSEVQALGQEQVLQEAMPELYEKDEGNADKI
mgnify:CR=1 FL=1